MFPTESNLESTFTLESGGTVVSDKTPFHILVLGNWTGNTENSTELNKRRPIAIERDNFDDVLRKLRPQLKLSFDNDSSLNLTFTEIDDFHPDNIFRQIPLFENLRDIRKKLKNSDTFNEAAREVRSWFSETETALKSEEPAETQSSTVIESDNLLDQILGGTSGDSTPYKRKVTESSELSNFINDIVSPHLVRIDLAEQSSLLLAVDEVISDLMRKILHHKDFQALESAWRGLYFLVMKTDTDTDLKFYLFDMSKDECADNLKAVKSLVESVYYQWTAGETLETTFGERWAVVCGNYEFAPNVDDIATLVRLSKIGNSSHTPFISHISSKVLGVDSLADTPTSRDWNLSEDSSESKLWYALRNTSQSEFLGMAMPRFLIRLPYGMKTDPIESFSFEEFNESSNHESYLWTNPSFACAYLLAKSFRKYGWEMAENIAREINGLPMHVYEEDDETKMKPCAEIPMTELSVQKMIDVGAIPFVSFRDSDKIRIASFQSIALTGGRLKGRWF